MTKLETQTLDAAAEAAEDSRNKTKRKRLLLILGATVLSSAISYALYSHYYGSKFISTDNAYTAAENAQITPAISGIVREVRVNDTQRVIADTVVMTIATQSPVARDLRFLMALDHVAFELERIGDHASGIAKQVRWLVEEPVLPRDPRPRRAAGQGRDPAHGLARGGPDPRRDQVDRRARR